MESANQRLDCELIRAVRAGDELARIRLVEKYQPMVRHLASKHYASFLDMDDLYQEGMIGLLGAIEEYRPDAFDVKFSSFAYLCIVRKIYNAIKLARGNKHRLLNEAISLAAAREEGDRPLVEVIASEHVNDPEEAALRQWARARLDAVLQAHLSILEYRVIIRVLAGFSVREIARDLAIDAKTIDNARTRIKAKLRKLIVTHGSLLGASVPLARRRRTDLFRPLPVSAAAGQEAGVHRLW